MFRKYSSILIAATFLLALLLSTVNCTGEKTLLNTKWSYSDLRALDRIDGLLYNFELLALYYRYEKSSGAIQFRLDLLDLTLRESSDFIIAVDLFPGGENNLPWNTSEDYSGFYWDVFIHFDTSGASKIENEDGEVIISNQINIEFDTFLDAIYLSLPAEVLSYQSNMTVLAMVSDSIHHEASDVIGPIQSGSPPPLPIPIMILFWDALGGSTPAQALRSWDGAHTGPDRSRHGFRHLAEAVNEYNVPVFIIYDDQDITLSSLEYLGKSKFVFVLLKDYLFFIDNLNIVNSVNDYAQYHTQSNISISTPNVLSKDLLTDFLLSLPYRQDNRIHVIGGSFRNSSWGSPEIVWPTLEYISHHPWIHPINMVELNAGFNTKVIRTVNGNLSGFESSRTIFNIGPNRLTDFAVDMNKYQTSKTSDIQQLLDRKYIGQLGHIKAAEEWSKYPRKVSDCSSDIDLDGDNECVLATDKIFTSYELTGGYLAFAYYLSDGELHQLIGPANLLDPRYSVATSYEQTNDISTDQIYTLGALVDVTSLFNTYRYKFDHQALELFTKNMAIRKVFSLTTYPDTIKISVIYNNSVENKHLSIPIILDPWIRFEPEWQNSYTVNHLFEKWELSIDHGILLEVTSPQEISVVSFLDPLKIMTQSEDPNLDYSKGYFLPFPLILLETDITNHFEVQINIMIQK